MTRRDYDKTSDIGGDGRKHDDDRSSQRPRSLTSSARAASRRGSTGPVARSKPAGSPARFGSPSGPTGPLSPSGSRSGSTDPFARTASRPHLGASSAPSGVKSRPEGRKALGLTGTAAYRTATRSTVTVPAPRGGARRAALAPPGRTPEQIRRSSRSPTRMPARAKPTDGSDHRLEPPAVPPAATPAFDQLAAHQVSTMSAASSARSVERSRRPRRLAVTGFVAVALVAAGAVGLASLLDAGRDPSANRQPASPVEAQTDAAAPGRPSDALVPPASATRGIVTTATVGADGVIQVSETVGWPAGGPADIRLELPDPVDLSGVDAALQPRVQNLTVMVDGTAQPPIGLAGSPNSWLVTTPDNGSPREMVVRYRLTGAVFRTTESDPGRALAVISPISVASNGTAPVEIRLTGDGVLNVGCPLAGDLESRLCARVDGGTWVAQPPAGTPAVVAVQLDLEPLA